MLAPWLLLMRLNLAWLQCDPQGMLGACQVLGRVLSQSSSCSGEIRKTFSEMVLPLQCFVANQRGWIQASGLPSSENPKFPVIFVQCELMEFPYGLRAFESWWCRHCAIRELVRLELAVSCSLVMERASQPEPASMDCSCQAPCTPA